MSSYAPPYTITDRMLTLVSAISEKVGRISEHNRLESRPHLRRNNKIESVYSSLRIEASSLTLGEVRDVINGRVVLGSAKEIQEVKNAYDAYEQIKSIQPFDLNDLKRMHGVMTRYIMSESGVFRQGEEGVFSGGRCIFMAPPPQLVPEHMQRLFEWMNQNKNRVHPLILSAVFHYEFVFIHPFADGNGRMARLWHTALLTYWKPVFEYISLESQIEKFQEGYYQAIAACHSAGNSNLFIEFMLERISQILDDILTRAKQEDPGISEYENRLLSAMAYDVPYTANALLDMLGLKSKEALRKNYLGPALAHGAVVMTLPDKPSSRQQRYVKK